MRGVNGTGVVGVAPAAYLYGVKVLSNSGSGNWSWLIAGIDWCIQKKMRVLSMSLGGRGAPAALEAMCNAAWNKGLLLVAAAGNSGQTSDPSVGEPARYQSVIAVSAIDNANVLAPFSSRGPEVELCAPGVKSVTIPGAGSAQGAAPAGCPPSRCGGGMGGQRYVNNVLSGAYWRGHRTIGRAGRDPVFVWRVMGSGRCE